MGHAESSIEDFTQPVSHTCRLVVQGYDIDLVRAGYAEAEFDGPLDLVLFEDSSVLYLLRCPVHLKRGHADGVKGDPVRRGEGHVSFPSLARHRPSLVERLDAVHD